MNDESVEKLKEYLNQQFRALGQEAEKQEDTSAHIVYSATMNIIADIQNKIYEFETAEQTTQEQEKEYER